MTRIFSILLILCLTWGCDEHQEKSHDDHEGHEEKSRADHEDQNDQDEPEGHEEHEAGEVIKLSAEAMRSTGITVVRAERKVLPHVLLLTGELDYPPTSVAHVAPRLSGNVLVPLVNIGDEVKRGDAIADIRSGALGELRARYLAARAKFRILDRNRIRLVKLRKKQLANQSEVVAARAAIETARAEKQAFRERLLVLGLASKEIDGLKFGTDDPSRLRVTAPARGRVIKLHASIGEHVSPEEPLAVVADDRVLDLWVHVPSKAIAHIHKDNQAEIRTPAWAGRVFPGRVDYIGHRVNSNSRLLRTRVRVPNENGLLKPGMLVNVTILETEPGHENDTVQGTQSGQKSSPKKTRADTQNEGHKGSAKHSGEHGHGKKHKDPNETRTEDNHLKARNDGHPHSGAHHDEHIKPLVVVPTNAVRKDKMGHHVYVQLSPGSYQRRAVAVSRTALGLVGIEHGLKADEFVVTKGAFLIASVAKKGALGHGHGH